MRFPLGLPEGNLLHGIGFRMSTGILLATYNGAPYLREWLASLERQTFSNWQLLVRDDSSTDTTSAILAEAAAADRRIRVLHDSFGRQGPAQNFGLLMKAALVRKFDHVAFADQDDVWLPDKLARQLDLMRRAEESGGCGVPLLFHSDLTVVDERLTTLHPSFMRWSDLPSGDAVTAARLLVRNSVVGCTMLANRALLDLAVPAPAEMVMHDWWLGLLAATKGQLLYEDAPTVLYRQHANNEVGAATLRQKLSRSLRDWRPTWNRALRNFRDGVLQVRALRDRLREREGGRPSASFAVVDAFCRLFDGEHRWITRLRQMHRLGIRESGWLRQAVLAARVAAFEAGDFSNASVAHPAKSAGGALLQRRAG
jgi:rhamnosyltransferase